MILPLMAVRNDRRAFGFKPFKVVSNGIFVLRSEVGILRVASCDSLDEHSDDDADASSNRSWIVGHPEVI
jgi:hypothetical protein